MIREAIDIIINRGRSLTEEEAAGVMEEIMTGEAAPAQLGAFLVALRMKGETADEIVGMARVMRGKALRVEHGGLLLDTCGTGGDGLGAFNVSTASAFVAAACGVTVAKHGNRAASSACGSADVLEALGTCLELTPEQVASCLAEVGVGFMFAPAFHPAMRFAAGPRRELGIRTVFNLLGPLTNPAGAQHQVLGVAHNGLAETMALALLRLGCRHALVVHGEDGLDELSIAGVTQVWEVKDGAVSSFQVAPEDVGLERSSLASVAGGTPQENAEKLRGVLEGGRGPLRDFVLLNTGAALVASDKAADLAHGVRLAAAGIDSGDALGRLERFVAMTKAFCER